jgi:NAD(P)H-quinone oxidoreductase subunit 5
MLSLSGSEAWPWWWSAVLGLAWAPLLWLPTGPAKLFECAVHTLSGLMIATALTVTALLFHVLPLGTLDTPHHWLGLLALLGMVGLYLCLSVVQIRPQLISTWRRWSYAGFYVDEAYTQLALKLRSTRWMPEHRHNRASRTDAPLVQQPQ